MLEQIDIVLHVHATGLYVLWFHLYINPLMPIIIVQHFYEFYTSKQLFRIHLTRRVTQIKILLINTENMTWKL